MTPLPITFLSDYGYADEFAGVCRAVISGICPEAQVIDLTHGIPRHDVTAGAFALANALPHCPAGVHLAVVDPGVGSDRRALAIQTADGRLLVGPDNGLLSPAADVCGGVGLAVDIGTSPFSAEQVSATFHGRDIFAPVTAQLATGASLQQVGDEVDSASLTGLALPTPRLEAGRIVAHVLLADGFGNLTLDLTSADEAARFLGSAPAARLRTTSGSFELKVGATFSDVAQGEPLLFEDSSGRYALAVNGADAGHFLGLSPGDELVIAPN